METVAQVPGIGARTVVLGGLSKEFAAGGLRVGWMATRDAALLAAVREAGPGVLPLPVARAASHLYAAWAQRSDATLVYPERHRALQVFLARVRQEFAQLHALFVEAFSGQGDEVVNPRGVGGLFLAPRVTAWLGKAVDGETLTPENLPAVLCRHAHVVVSAGSWCHEPERVRAVFSLPREKVERAARGAGGLRGQGALTFVRCASQANDRKAEADKQVMRPQSQSAPEWSFSALPQTRSHAPRA